MKRNSGQRKEILTTDVLQDRIFVWHQWRSEGIHASLLDDHDACGLLSLRKQMNPKLKQKSEDSAH